MTAFGPELQKSKLIKKDCLREFLLSKLLNAEYACHNAPQFKDKMVSVFFNHSLAFCSIIYIVLHSISMHYIVQE